MGKATKERPAAVTRVEPTPEWLRRNTGELVQVKDPEQAAPIVVRRAATRNLERWWARKLISGRHYLAGDRYRSDFELAGFNPKVTSCYEPVTAGGQAGHYRAPGGQNERQMDAWHRWREARAVLPVILRDGFERMTIFEDIGLEVVALNADGVWTPRTCVPMAIVCLEELAEFYQMPDETDCHNGGDRPKR